MASAAVNGAHSPSPDTDRSAVSTAVWCGVIAGPLFVLAALIIGSVRHGYSQVRLPISLLAVGNHGWMQIANFVVCGLMMIALALGMRTTLHGRGSTWGPRLIGIVGLGLIGAGLFPTDPGGGFPPHGQAEPGPTVHGHLHDLFSIAVFVGLPSTMFVLAQNLRGRGERGWARVSMIGGVALAVGFIVVLVAFNTEVLLADVAGLIQRLWVAFGFGLLSVNALHLHVVSTELRDSEAQNVSTRIER